MSKNIIFCADGTWDGAGSDNLDNHTNVLKLFQNISGIYSLESMTKADEQEISLCKSNNEVVQIAKYIHGVGDSRNPIIKIMGGVFGSGTIARIVRGYTFLSRNFEPGDQIYLIGFSRGAYTVRALAGMISDAGLLNANICDLSDKELSYSLGIETWCEYRERKGRNLNLLNGLNTIRHTLPKDAHIANVPIRCIGVWDTVGALGVPFFHFGGSRVDVFEFADLRLSPNVGQGFHAVSIDELRTDFAPTLWDDDHRVEQVLFSGAHGDVGGGYEKTGLSDCALEWMLNRMQRAGILFVSPHNYTPKPDPLAEAHEPWKLIAEIFPKPREFRRVVNIHRSVSDRLIGLPTYLPINLFDFLVKDTRTFKPDDVTIIQ